MGEPLREEVNNQVESNRQDANSNFLQQVALLLEQMLPYDKKEGKDLENVRLKLAYPKKGLPTSLEEVDRLMNSTEDMLQFFAPETRHNKLEYISKAALELYGFKTHFPEKNIAESIAFRVANVYMPEDTEMYAPRREFMRQQIILGKLAEGGLLRLPDLTLILNEDGKYLKVFKVRSHSDHLFSEEGEFLGTLISLRSSSISKRKYDELRAAKRLISPTRQELMEMVEERKRALLRHHCE